MKISVLGAGGWGTTLAILLHYNGHDVTLWEYYRSYAKELNKKQADALERQGGKWGENSPHKAVSDANEQAIKNTAENYKGGKKALIRDAHLANGWDTKKGDEPSSRVQEAAQSRVEKATRTEYQKFVLWFEYDSQPSELVD